MYVFHYLSFSVLVCSSIRYEIDLALKLENNSAPGFIKVHHCEYTIYSCYIMLARIVLRHTKTMQSSYNKELVEHQMDSRGQSPIVKSSQEKQASRKSLHKFKKRTDTVKSETNSTSNMQQSINRVKQSKNQIYKSTIW